MGIYPELRRYVESWLFYILKSIEPSGIAVPHASSPHCRTHQTIAFSMNHAITILNFIDYLSQFPRHAPLLKSRVSLRSPMGGRSHKPVPYDHSISEGGGNASEPQHLYTTVGSRQGNRLVWGTSDSALG